MQRLILGLACAGLLAAAAPHTTQAQGKTEWSFQRVGTFANYRNASLDQHTVSEIIAASADGKTLIYTDAVRGALGLIDITNPSDPQPAGTLALDPNPDDDVSYSPTSVAVLSNQFAQYALVAVDTSTSFTGPSGELQVIDLATRATVKVMDLGGQPDSVKVSPNHRYVAIAIENQRDENLPMPQLPAGFLAVIATSGPPGGWVRQDVQLTGLADRFGDDPEPEFVDINKANEAVVTLQENNHVVIVDLPTLQVVSEFPAGTVSLTAIDTVRADTGLPNTIALTDTQNNQRREPDAVAWVGDRIATANEGDLDGGTRGFSLFTHDGLVVFDSGNTLEHLAVRAGHYPERRSNSKGTEPEAVAAARFGLNDLLFVGSERGSFVAVYALSKKGGLEFAQLLPGPLGPEGLLPIPGRNLLVVAGETETDPFSPLGVRSTVMIYELKPGGPAYPHIQSANDAGGTPIPWSALSGMTEVPGQPDRVQAVWDSFFTPSRIFTIDITRTPALITSALTIQRPDDVFYDPEGLAYAPDGSLWIASEGNANDSRPNRLIKVDPVTGAVQVEIELPVADLTCRAAERAKALATPLLPNGTGTFGSGFEGLDIAPKPGGGYLIYVAQQRGWNYTTSPECDLLDDDPIDMGNAAEPTWTRIWVYDPQAPAGTAWSHVKYQLSPKPPRAAWIGLSEITLTRTGWILIERDNLTGDFGEYKTLTQIPLTPGADDQYTNDEKTVFDLMPVLESTNGWITDKPEGVAVLNDDRLFVVTDNDGVDGWSGETWFFGLGPFWQLFQ